MMAGDFMAADVSFLAVEANNVAAEVVEGNLIVTGDDGDNHVIIEQDESANYAIKPFGFTRVNGQDAGEAALISRCAVTGDIIIKMNAGDDKVIVHGRDWPAGGCEDASDVTLGVGDFREATGINNLIADLGDGSDLIHIYKARVGKDIELSSGRGPSRYIVTRSTVEGGVSTKSSQHNDVDGRCSTILYVQNSTIGGNVTVENDGGMDSVRFTSSNVHGDVDIENGEGGSSVSILESTLHGDFEISNGNGFDRFYYSDSLVKGDVELNNGDGRALTQIVHQEYYGAYWEKVFVDAYDRPSIQGKFEVNNGTGNSQFYARDADFGERVEVQHGNDRSSTSLYGVTFHGDVVISTGEGRSCLRIRDANFDKDLSIVNVSYSPQWTNRQFTTLENVFVGGDLDISHTGGGSEVTFNNVVVWNDLNIHNKGQGSDAMYLNWVFVFGDTTIDAGAGSDFVWLNNTWFRGDVYLDGGSDTSPHNDVDVVCVAGFNNLNRSDLGHFEYSYINGEWIVW